MKSFEEEVNEIMGEINQICGVDMQSETPYKALANYIGHVGKNTMHNPDFQAFWLKTIRQALDERRKDGGVMTNEFMGYTPERLLAVEPFFRPLQHMAMKERWFYPYPSGAAFLALSDADREAAELANIGHHLNYEDLMSLAPEQIGQFMVINMLSGPHLKGLRVEKGGSMTIEEKDGGRTTHPSPHIRFQPGQRVTADIPHRTLVFEPIYEPRDILQQICLVRLVDIEVRETPTFADRAYDILSQLDSAVANYLPKMVRSLEDVHALLNWFTRSGSDLESEAGQAFHLKMWKMQLDFQERGEEALPQDAYAWQIERAKHLNHGAIIGQPYLTLSAEERKQARLAELLGPDEICQLTAADAGRFLRVNTTDLKNTFEMAEKPLALQMPYEPAQVFSVGVGEHVLGFEPICEPEDIWQQMPIVRLLSVHRKDML